MLKQETTGQRIWRFRKAKGWSQPRLSRESGLNPTTISRLENDHFKPQERTLIDLGRVLGVTADEIRGEIQS